MSAPPIYLATILEIERLRLSRGISMEQMSELMGTAERSYAKMLYPDTISGRMARHDTLQLAVQTVCPDGFDLRILPSRCGMLSAVGTKQKIKAEAAHWDGKRTSEIMAHRGRKGNAARQASLTPEQRSALSRMAAESRWGEGSEKQRERQAARARAQASKRTQTERSAIARKAAAARWAKVRGDTQAITA
jgi:hypothetical protein